MRHRGTREVQHESDLHPRSAVQLPSESTNPSPVKPGPMPPQPPLPEHAAAPDGPGAADQAAERPDFRSTALREIGDVAEELDVPQHVLRYWEGKFSALRPRRVGGGRRRYSPKDVALLWGIKRLLYERHLTIDGAQKALRKEGIDAIRYPGTVPMDPGLRRRLRKLRDDLLAARADLAGS